jgi:hypothetical protein
MKNTIRRSNVFKEQEEVIQMRPPDLNLVTCHLVGYVELSLNLLQRHHWPYPTNDRDQGCG